MLTSDVNAVVGVTMLVGVVFVVVNFVVALLTSYIDPRIGLAGDSA